MKHTIALTFCSFLKTALHMGACLGKSWWVSLAWQGIHQKHIYEQSLYLYCKLKLIVYFPPPFLYSLENQGRSILKCFPYPHSFCGLKHLLHISCPVCGFSYPLPGLFQMYFSYTYFTVIGTCQLYLIWLTLNNRKSLLILS